MSMQNTHKPPQSHGWALCRHLNYGGKIGFDELSNEHALSSNYIQRSHLNL